MDWTDEQQAVWMTSLRRLASYKYDAYEGFSPGQRFFESLARWLVQFDEGVRARLVEFIQTNLVFISRDELNHTIECAYPHYIKRALVEDIALRRGIERYRVKAITQSEEFRTLRRKTLYLGLSDGARLDRFRRSNPELSHEQFWLAPELGSFARERMAEKLAEAIVEAALQPPAEFQKVVLVDDFYGSGTSLLDKDESGNWTGKLKRAQNHIEQLKQPTKEGLPALLTSLADVAVVLYVASHQAEDHIRTVLSEFEPSWVLFVVQHLPKTFPVDEQWLLEVCDDFWDPKLEDRHKKRAARGYKDAALPLVLHHNTPNNSICILWADSTDRVDGQKRKAIFPRYERHHVDRP